MTNLVSSNLIRVVLVLLGIFSSLLSVSAQRTDVRGQKTEKPELVVQDGHHGGVGALVISPNGAVLASSSRRNTKLWDIKSGRLIRNILSDSYSIQRLAFSPDGELLATADEGSSPCQVWEVKSGRLVRSFTELKGSTVASLAFSPNGKTFALAAGPIYVWDLRENSPLRKFGQEAKALQFSPNGEIIASANRANEVELWQAETSKLLRSIPANVAILHDKAISFSPDGKTIAVLTNDQTIDLWEINTGNSIRNLSSPEYDPKVRGLQAVAFNSDGTKLLVLVNPNTSNVINHLDVWDLASRKVIRQIPQRGGMKVRQDIIAFSPDRRSFVTAFEDEITFREIDTGNIIRTFKGHDNSTASLMINPLDEKILLNPPEASPSVWDANQSLICKLEGEEGGFRSIEFSPDGKTFLVQQPSGDASFWNQRDCSNLSRASDIKPVFTPDGKNIAVIAQQSIKVYSTEKQELGRILRGHKERIVSMTFSPDGKLIASASEDNTVKVWNWETGQALYSLETPQFRVYVVAFSPDGKTLATADGDYPISMRAGRRQINLWEAGSGKPLRSFGDHQWAVTSLTFSSDGKLLASSSKDKTVKIWNLSDGRLVQSLEKLVTDIALMVFSPEGKTLITRSETRDQSTVRFWDISTGRLLNQVPGSRRLRAINFSADGKTVAIAGETVSEDTTTDLYSTSGELLANVIGFDKSWVVTTPDGLFDGSPESWSRINWRFAGNEVAPVEVFFDDFYYPGLLTDVLRGKRPTASADINRKDRRQPEVRFLSDVSPPAGSSEEERIVSQRNFAIRLEIAEAASDKAHATGSGARDVRLFRNGSLVKIWHGNLLPKGGKTVLETVVPLVSGENQFTAYAFNSDNVKSTDAEMRVRGHDSLARKGTAYIIAVGINHYSNPQYDLKYAVADAEAFSSELRTQLVGLRLFDQVQVVSLIDQQATKANILAALARLAGAPAKDSQSSSIPAINKIRSAQPEDAIVLYFASHGTARENEFYLIPHDMGYAGERAKLTKVGIENILDHSISDRALDQALEGIDAGRFLMVVDACNSGQVLEAEEKRRGPMNSKGLAQLAYEKGIYILTAAQSYQAALEVSQLGHGLLTYSLIEEGLRKASADDEPRDGQLTVREWLTFASESVPRMQIEKLKQARGLGLDLSFAAEPDRKSSREEERDLQRPRAFYRREVMPNPFVIALFK